MTPSSGSCGGDQLISNEGVALFAKPSSKGALVFKEFHLHRHRESSFAVAYVGIEA
jgi:hypothetical protein